ncbi:hypothetical protein H2203_004633 [Taxawa tesnikishii (nom. ined.)]|nr:hypothetical protein H2203_004633 [Dothideales sp. JES 119]
MSHPALANLAAILDAPPKTPPFSPKPQHWYAFSSGSWQPVPPSEAPYQQESSSGSLSLRLLTWNIDMLIPFGRPRMQRALEYLSELVATDPNNHFASESGEVSTAPPGVIILPEEFGDRIRGAVKDNAKLSSLPENDPHNPYHHWSLEEHKHGRRTSIVDTDPWVRERFYITDIDERNWDAGWYGTTTLIDRRLPVSNCFRVPMESRFGRDGLFVDIPLGIHNSEPRSTSDGAPASEPEDNVLRICNVHLESLSRRTLPLPLASSPGSQAARRGSPHIASGLITGDFNAIQPFDRTLHTDLNLRDAYLSLGAPENPTGRNPELEGPDPGFTWGFQSPPGEAERYGCSRMDKIMMCGAARARSLVRIGRG